MTHSFSAVPDSSQASTVIPITSSDHALGESLLLRWRREYKARGEAAFLPREATGTEVLEQRIVELERFCGQLALENAVLKKALNSSRSPNGIS